ncbi:hypothetical protein B0H11DRAFT_2265904 [Mycena galericulata]|nr:hypothetical protein B0H11DRAFT_2265904 [Mycena galericulata]
MPPSTIGRTPQQQVEDRDKAFLDAIYSSRYHRKNRDERNKKTRARMAKLRAQEATLPPPALAVRLEARREAARKYRAKNHLKIARGARERRRFLAKERKAAEVQEARDRYERMGFLAEATQAFHEAIYIDSVDDVPGCRAPLTAEEEGLIAIRRMEEEEELRRSTRYRMHRLGYVPLEEFVEMRGIFLGDDLDLYMEYKWLHTAWGHATVLTEPKSAMVVAVVLHGYEIGNLDLLLVVWPCLCAAAVFHPPMDSKSPSRCLPPWFPDDPTLRKEDCHKIYLATGENLPNAGAYSSWTTAGAIIHGRSSASAPIYHSWEKAVAAWRVLCERGMHDHASHSPVKGVPPATAVSPSPAARRSTTRSERSSTAAPSTAAPSPGTARTRTNPSILKMPGFSTMPIPPREATTPSPSQRSFPSRTFMSRHGPAIVPAPPALRAYAIRWADTGVVCGSFGEAKQLYEELDGQGQCPRMLTTPSFVEAACFAEGFSVTEPTEEAQQRKRWVKSQENTHRARMADLHAAREHQLGGERQRAKEQQRAPRRDIVIDEAHELRGEEELARMRHRIARLEAELARVDWAGSSSFESLNEEQEQHERDDYEGYGRDPLGG